MLTGPLEAFEIDAWKPPTLPLKEVKPIVLEVKRRGLRALREFSLKFDGIYPEEIYGRPRPGQVPDFIQESIRRLRTCSKKFLELTSCELNGFKTDLMILRESEFEEPVKRVGIYVPGGRYPLPSSLIMGAIPAQVAGVEEIVVATPPRDPGMIEAIAHELGVKEVLRVGGAHAIAAIAFGIPEIGLEPVDMVVGPGGPYVTAAKKFLKEMDIVEIDLIAGPSEIVVVADEGDPTQIALDLLAQLEHGPDSPALFLSTSKELAKNVLNKVKKLSTGHLGNNLGVLFGEKERIVKLVNRIMPEHLEVFGEFPEMLAGAVFKEIGVVFGDYGMTGANHILPTNSSLLDRPGLSPLSFLGFKGSYYYLQRGDELAQSSVAEKTAAFARLEGLEFHARSAEARKLNK